MPAELLFLDEDDEMNIEEETNDLAIDSSEKTIETIILHRSSSVSCQLVSQSFFWHSLVLERKLDRNHLSKQIINNLTYF